MQPIVTDQVAWSVSVWVVDSGRPKEPCIRWVSILPHVKGQFFGEKARRLICQPSRWQTHSSTTGAVWHYCPWGMSAFIARMGDGAGKYASTIHAWRRCDLFQITLSTCFKRNWMHHCRQHSLHSQTGGMVRQGWLQQLIVTSWFTKKTKAVVLTIMPHRCFTRMIQSYLPGC